MIIAGKVKKAELVEINDWHTNAFLITIEHAGHEFIFPLATSEIGKVRIDDFMKFNIEANPVNQDSLSVVSNNDVKAEAKPTVNLMPESTEPVADFITNIPQPEEPTEDLLADDEIDAMYQDKITENQDTNFVAPKVETKLEDVTADNLKEASTTKEPEEPEISPEEQKQKDFQQRHNINVNYDPEESKADVQQEPDVSQDNVTENDEPSNDSATAANEEGFEPETDTNGLKEFMNGLQAFGGASDSEENDGE